MKRIPILLLLLTLTACTGPKIGAHIEHNERMSAQIDTLIARLQEQRELNQRMIEQVDRLHNRIRVLELRHDIP